MKANVGLTDKQRSGVVAILSKTLADLAVLSVKTRNYHWNVTGMHFHDLHGLFGKQYSDLDAKMDEVAEFIRYFGDKSPGSLGGFLALTELIETTGDLPAEEMVRNLLSDHEAIIRNLRKDIGTADEKFGAADVADFLTGLLEDHEKTAWMLRSLAA